MNLGDEGGSRPPRPARVGVVRVEEVEPWVELASCATVDPELWFPPPRDNEWRRAVQVCLRCPVRAQCLDYAMRQEAGLTQVHRYGIWGGLTPSRRSKLAAKVAS